MQNFLYPETSLYINKAVYPARMRFDLDRFQGTNEKELNPLNINLPTVASVIYVLSRCVFCGYYYRDQKMSNLQSIVNELEQKNQELKKSVDGVRSSVEEKLLSPRCSSPSLSR